MIFYGKSCGPHLSEKTSMRKIIVFAAAITIALSQSFEGYSQKEPPPPPPPKPPQVIKKKIQSACYYCRREKSE
jgi:hypothetical protein